jgi:hypothetical protein
LVSGARGSERSDEGNHGSKSAAAVRVWEASLRGDGANGYRPRVEHVRVHGLGGSAVGRIRAAWQLQKRLDRLNGRRLASGIGWRVVERST